MTKRSTATQIHPAGGAEAPAPFHWEVVLAAHPHVLCLVDPEGRIRSLNDAAKRAFQDSADDLDSLAGPDRLIDLVRIDDRERMRAALEEAVAGATPVLAARWTSSDGRDRWFEWTLASAGLVGSEKAVVAVARDVTEHRAVVDELRYANALLEERLQERTRSLAAAWTALEDQRREGTPGAGAGVAPVGTASGASRRRGAVPA